MRSYVGGCGPLSRGARLAAPRPLVEGGRLRLGGTAEGLQSAVPADAGRWVARVRCCGNVVGVKLRVVWLFPAVRGL